MDCWIFNVRKDVIDACNCTQGCTDTHKRVCTERCQGEKNPLLHWGIELASAAYRSDAVSAERSPRPDLYFDLFYMLERTYFERVSSLKADGMTGGRTALCLSDSSCNQHCTEYRSKALDSAHHDFASLF